VLYTTISVLTNATLVGVPGASPTNTTHLIRHEKTQTKRHWLSSRPLLLPHCIKRLYKRVLKTHTHKVLKKNKKKGQYGGSFNIFHTQKALKSLKIWSFLFLTCAGSFGSNKYGWQYTVYGYKYITLELGNWIGSQRIRRNTPGASREPVRVAENSSLSFFVIYVTGRILKIRYHTEIIDSIYLLCVPKNVRERGNSGFRCQVRKLEIKTRVLDGAHAGSLSKIKERRPPFSLSLYSVTFISFFLSPLILHFGVSSCRGGPFDSFTNNNTIKDISLALSLKQKKDVDLKGHARVLLFSRTDLSDPLRLASYTGLHPPPSFPPPYPPHPPSISRLFPECSALSRQWSVKKKRKVDWTTGWLWLNQMTISIYKSITDIFFSQVPASHDHSPRE
jgi:hypothetical protein